MDELAAAHLADFAGEAHNLASTPGGYLPELHRSPGAMAGGGRQSSTNRVFTAMIANRLTPATGTSPWGVRGTGCRKNIM
jgi:hypothetical protein